MKGTDYKALSFWHASVPDPLRPRPPLPGDRDVDVAIVGAGFTGLWTAVYLSALDPALRIAVIEREIAVSGPRYFPWGSFHGPYPFPERAPISANAQLFRRGCEALGIKPERSYTGGDRGWIGDNPFILLDCKKMRSLGWAPKLAIREGILNTLAYLQENTWLLEARA